jgi:hypothetical protein
MSCCFLVVTGRRDWCSVLEPVRYCLLRDGAWLTRARGGAWPILPICERGLEFIFDTGRGAIVNVLIARSDVAGYAQTHETSVVDIQ